MVVYLRLYFNHKKLYQLHQGTFTLHVCLMKLLSSIPPSSANGLLIKWCHCKPCKQNCKVVLEKSNLAALYQVVFEQVKVISFWSSTNFCYKFEKNKSNLIRKFIGYMNLMNWHINQFQLDINWFYTRQILMFSLLD